jgi:hypothetical protein
MKFTQIPASTFEELQLNAGVLLSEFDPSTGAMDRANILGATTGGVSFTDAPSYTDLGEDIDNCPRNTKELKRVDTREITMSGTYVTVNTAIAKSLVAAADLDSGDTTKITPRDILKDSDFEDIWWVGDYSNVNTGENAGFIAIKLVNALSTGGFSLTSGNRAKGQFGFTYTAHYSMEDPDAVPYEMYVKQGEE